MFIKPFLYIISQKRTICEIIGSNFIAHAQKIDITLYPVFYDVLEMNKLNAKSNDRFELTETQLGQQKRASKKALELNGGTYLPKLELLKNVITPEFVRALKLIA